jgi:hypothetical protein
MNEDVTCGGPFHVGDLTVPITVPVSFGEGATGTSALFNVYDAIMDLRKEVEEIKQLLGRSAPTPKSFSTDSVKYESRENR